MNILAARSILSLPVICPPIPSVAPRPQLLLMAPGQVGPGSYHRVDAAPTSATNAHVATATIDPVLAGIVRRLQALCKLGRHLVSGPTIALPASTESADRPGVHWTHSALDNLTPAARKHFVPAAVKLLDRAVMFLSAESANYEVFASALADFDQIIRRIGRDECGFKNRDMTPPSSTPRTIERPVPGMAAPTPTYTPKPPLPGFETSATPEPSMRERAATLQRLLKSICRIEIAIPIGTAYEQDGYRYVLQVNAITHNTELMVLRTLPPPQSMIRAAFLEGEAEKYQRWHTQAEAVYAKALAAQQRQDTEKLQSKERRRAQRFETRKALG
jgi:hypothetical protein